MHVGFFGPTECGKTTLAQAIAQEKQRAGLACLVCDPLGKHWPAAAWQTTDAAAFMAKAQQATNCRLFIEEASLSINRDRDLSWLFVTARHRYHWTHIIGQDGASLTPAMRQQLSRVYLFRCHPDLAAIWARQFARPEIVEEAATLERYEFLICETFAPTRRARLAL